MQSIKIRLEIDEFAPIQRLAAELNLSVENVGYAALDALMSKATDEAVRTQIQSSAVGRKGSLPKWADRPREVHAYESMT